MKKLFGALLLGLIGCTTNPVTGEHEFDIVAARQELHLVRMDIQGALEVYAVGNPSMQEDLAKAVEAADKASAALDTWLANREDPQAKISLIESLDLTLIMAGDLIDTYAETSDDATRIRLVMYAAEVIIRRIEAHVE